jgi:putative ABC transport system permease protein
MEATLIAISAGVIGYLLSMGATRLALLFFADNPHVALPWNLTLAAGALVMSLVVGVLASIYPALAAARMDPNDALRAL